MPDSISPLSGSRGRCRHVGFREVEGTFVPAGTKQKAGEERYNKQSAHGVVFSGKMNSYFTQDPDSMTESEFLKLTDEIFTRIENALDDSGLDAEPMRAGNVLEIELADGSKVIVNRHTFNQEVWIAAKSGGFHYRLQDGDWRNTREAGEFFSDLEKILSVQSGEPFSF